MNVEKMMPQEQLYWKQLKAAVDEINPYDHGDAVVQQIDRVRAMIPRVEQEAMIRALTFFGETTVDDLAREQPDNPGLPKIKEGLEWLITQLKAL